MSASWRWPLGLDADFHRLGSADPLRAQILWEALTRAPDGPRAEDPLRIPSVFGPWSISRAGVGFAWTLDGVTHADTFRRRLREWRTERPSPDTVRLALIGESAAGSWGFMGDYCLSGLLGTTLTRSLARPVEVVDLTVVNGVWERDCLPAVHAAMTLDPDVFVVFCANNEARWLLPSLAHGDLLGVPGGFAARWSTMLCGGADAVRALNVAYTQQLASSLARTVELIRAFGKEIVFVVAPFNLRDWRPPELLPHHLTAGQLREWQDAMAAGDARAAVEIDGGLCQASLHTLGQAQLAEDPVRATATLDRAVGAGLGPFANAVPSLPPVGRARLVELLRAFRVPFVDLPALLSVDGPPGREYFLDYCHLSAAGHELLVTHLARTVLRFTGLREHRVEDLSVDKPSDHERALAALVAAVHNFQNGQPDELVLHWLRAAAQHRDVRQIASFFAATVATMHRERVTIAALREAGLVDAFLNERWLIFGLKFLYHERFDVDLQALIALVVSDVDIGAIAAPARELHRLFYLDRRRGFGQTEREMSRRGWEQVGEDFVAYDLAGRVEFPGAPGEATLRVVVSPPWTGSAQRLRLTLDGAPIGDVAFSEPYTMLELAVSLSDGINRLEFAWDELFCPQEIDNPDERHRYWLTRGAYPIAAVLHELSIVPT